jgi:ATP-dependent DNA helicase PIF1
MKKVYNYLRKLDILVIDEVSMLEDALCDKISHYLQVIRECPKPFGGMQMVFCGDFAQLKPVKGNYCFKSQEWQRLDPRVVMLRTQHRQEGDMVFQELLSHLRLGQVSDMDYALLKSCMKTKFPEWIEPTKVYSLNVDVDAINGARFDTVCASADPDTVRTYATVYTNPKMKNLHTIPDAVTLCPGLQVMLTWNIPLTTLVNGTRGRIVSTHDSHVILALVNGDEVSITMHEITPEEHTLDKRDAAKDVVRFMPLRLAYAITCHKTQGMTLDCMEVDLGKSIFEYGQAYTALSRARSLKSVKITKLCRSSFKTHPDVLEFYATHTST